jgi:hypothetical protein
MDGREPDSTDVVEVVYRDPYDLPPDSLQDVGQVVGKGRLARAVGTVDAYPDTILAGRTWHRVG